MFKCVYRLMVSTFIALTAFMDLHAQQEMTDSLQKQFNRHQLQSLQEKIFVHTDKTFYLAGEMIWFKVYDVDANFNRPMNSSSISYLEIISNSQKPVLQASIDTRNGKGSGSLLIPASVSSGNYTLRAYTSWMKNFSPDLYFQQQITIVNTLNDTTEYGNNSSNTYHVQFFPEGGNLVAELPSKLAFKAVNQYGTGVDCKGIILNQKKDTITSFRSTRFGMGHCMLTPKKGETYYGLITIGDSVIFQKLPSVDDQGYVMSLDESTNGQIKISVHCNTTVSNPGVYLFVHTNQLVKNVQAGFISHNEASFYIDKKDLADGISHFTVFNADRNPVCERLYFKPPVNKLFVEATPGQATYGPRKKIDIDLQAKDASGRPLKANLSLSVFMLDDFQSVPQENIVNYLMLSADLKGKIDSPQYYIENKGPDVAETTDNLMLTQGWTRFRWEDVLQNKKPSFEFLPEPEGPVLNGKIIDKRTGLPAPATTAYLSLPGKNFELSSAASDAGGNIRFTLNRFYGINEIVVQTNGVTDSNYRVDMSSPYSDKFSSSAIPGMVLPPNWTSSLLNRSINSQAENTYLVTQKHQFLKQAASDTTPFYGKPDVSYRLDDYTRFATVEEVMREYIAGVRVRKESGKFEYRVRNDLFNVFFQDPPLILVDGVPVFDADKIMAVDPLKIKAIDIVSRKYYLGPLISDGIVSYKTYEGDLSGYQLDPNAVLLQFNGLQQKREFYKPDYDDKKQLSGRIPDFRNVLYWSPDVQTSELGKSKLSFYSSDLTGKFAVVVQGLSEDGLPGSTVVRFTVAKDGVSN